MPSFKIESTRNARVDSTTVMIYGPPGSGKTRLCATLPHDKTLIINAERGLLSIAEFDIDSIKISCIVELREIIEAIESSHHQFRKYEWIALDSLSEIAEVCLSEFKGREKDARKAYGDMTDEISSIIRRFRDCDRHVYMSLKRQTVIADDREYYYPSMPTRKLTEAVGHFPDFVGTITTAHDETGAVRKALSFQRTRNHDACKDRSGKLNTYERMHLGKLLDKIQGHGNDPEEEGVETEEE